MHLSLASEDDLESISGRPSGHDTIAVYSSSGFVDTKCRTRFVHVILVRDIKLYFAGHVCFFYFFFFLFLPLVPPFLIHFIFLFVLFLLPYFIFFDIISFCSLFHVFRFLHFPASVAFSSLLVTSISYLLQFISILYFTLPFFCPTFLLLMSSL